METLHHPAKTEVRQYNLYVHGQLHQTAGDNYHKIYDLGSDPEFIPTNLTDARLVAEEDFQSVTRAYLETSITTTVLLTE
jgi:hypothetical protein